MTHHRLLIGGASYTLPAWTDLDDLRDRLLGAVRRGADFVSLPVQASAGMRTDVVALVSAGLPVVIESVTTADDAEPVHAGAARAESFLEEDWLDTL
jgi:hypothetical protein